MNTPPAPPVAANEFGQKIVLGLPAVDADSAAKLPHWSGERVLLVEDMAINRKLAIALLEKLGLSVAVAVHGQEALDQLAREDFRLVLMDIQMPVMDGLTATRHIRANPRWISLPILALTAHADADDQARTCTAGMNAHLSKPIRLRTLADALSRWLPPTGIATAARANDPTNGNEMRIDWPALPGIDLGAGLALHLHRPALYLKSLHAFRQDFSTSPDQLRQLLSDGENATAQRLAHSLKSIAAALGAGPLSVAAHTIEKELGKLDRNTLIELHIDAFEHEFGIMIGGLSKLPTLPSMPIAPTVAEWPELEQLFDRLAEMLAAGEAQSGAQFDSLRSALAEPLSSRNDYATAVAKIAELIDDVEFESALKGLEQLRQSLKKHQA